VHPFLYRSLSWNFNVSAHRLRCSIVPLIGDRRGHSAAQADEFASPMTAQTPFSTSLLLKPTLLPARAIKGYGNGPGQGNSILPKRLQYQELPSTLLLYSTSRILLLTVVLATCSLQAINESVQRRPKSRELLPPMDGFNPVSLSSQPPERPASLPNAPLPPPAPRIVEPVSADRN
jgi:hypothetical protein